jgi:hypothetical protein
VLTSSIQANKQIKQNKLQLVKRHAFSSFGNEGEVQNGRSCLTAPSLESLSSPDVGKSRSAISLEKLQNRTVSIVP